MPAIVLIHTIVTNAIVSIIVKIYLYVCKDTTFF